MPYYELLGSGENQGSISYQLLPQGESHHGHLPLGFFRLFQVTLCCYCLSHLSPYLWLGITFPWPNMHYWHCLWDLQHHQDLGLEIFASHCCNKPICPHVAAWPYDYTNSESSSLSPDVYTDWWIHLLSTSNGWLGCFQVPPGPPPTMPTKLCPAKQKHCEYVRYQPQCRCLTCCICIQE